MQVSYTTVKSNKPLDRTGNQSDAENTTGALKEAEKDISNDPDLAPDNDPAADLDEGELARLEGED